MARLTWCTSMFAIIWLAIFIAIVLGGCPDDGFSLGNTAVMSFTWAGTCNTNNVTIMGSANLIVTGDAWNVACFISITGGGLTISSNSLQPFNLTVGGNITMGAAMLHFTWLNLYVHDAFLMTSMSILDGAGRGLKGGGTRGPAQCIVSSTINGSSISGTGANGGSHSCPGATGDNNAGNPSKYDTTVPATLIVRPGCGGGGFIGSSTISDGGSGGAALFLYARYLRVGGSIDVHGGDGTSGVATGGGAGGGVILLYDTLELLTGHAVKAFGGNGNKPTTGSLKGGGGSGGVVHSQGPNVICSTPPCTLNTMMSGGRGPGVNGPDTIPSNSPLSYDLGLTFPKCGAAQGQGQTSDAGLTTGITTESQSSSTAQSTGSSNSQNSNQTSTASAAASNAGTSAAGSSTSTSSTTGGSTSSSSTSGPATTSTTGASGGGGSSGATTETSSMSTSGDSTASSTSSPSPSSSASSTTTPTSGATGASTTAEAALSDAANRDGQGSAAPFPVALVGGIVGALLILIFIAIALVVAARRRQKAAKDRGFNEDELTIKATDSSRGLDSARRLDSKRAETVVGMDSMTMGATGTVAGLDTISSMTATPEAQAEPKIRAGLPQQEPSTTRTSLSVTRATDEKTIRTTSVGNNSAVALDHTQRASLTGHEQTQRTNLNDNASENTQRASFSGHEPTQRTALIGPETTTRSSLSVQEKTQRSTLDGVSPRSSLHGNEQTTRQGLTPSGPVLDESTTRERLPSTSTTTTADELISEATQRAGLTDYERTQRGQALPASGPEPTMRRDFAVASNSSLPLLGDELPTQRSQL